MYLDQLRHEQLVVTQGWMTISGDISRFMRRVAGVLRLRRDAGATVFEPHRVPDADKLR